MSISATAVAHDIHYAVLGIGVVGLLVLLGPQWVGAHRGLPPRDEHAQRVQALTEQIASGGLGRHVTPPVPSALLNRPVGLDPVRARYLPLAVIGSTAAAGVHAAVGPAHFREQVLFGLFFAGAALAQIAWSMAMVVRPGRSLLMAAVVGNSAVLALWATTRTIGLPGLLPNPESVGPWDLFCAAWELLVVINAGRALRAADDRVDSRVDLRLPAWPDWDPSARAWAVGSVLVLLALTLIGASA
jgi:hypothetical protein